MLYSNSNKISDNIMSALSVNINLGVYNSFINIPFMNFSLPSLPYENSDNFNYIPTISITEIPIKKS